MAPFAKLSFAAAFMLGTDCYCCWCSLRAAELRRLCKFWMLPDMPFGLFTALLFFILVGQFSCLSMRRLINAALCVLIIELCFEKQLLISISLTLSIDVDLLRLPPRDCSAPMIFCLDC